MQDQPIENLGSNTNVPADSELLVLKNGTLQRATIEDVLKNTSINSALTQLNGNLAVTGAHQIWAIVPPAAYWGDYFVFLPMANAATIKSVVVTSVVKRSGNSESDLTSSFTFNAKTRDGILLKTKDTSCAGALCAFTITVS